MKRRDAVAAVAVAWVLAALAGLNRWASGWLDAGFVWYEAVLTGTILIAVIMLPQRWENRTLRTVIATAVAGYLGGILGLGAANLAFDDPLRRIARSVSGNPTAAAAVFAVYPAVLGSWALGLVAAIWYVIIRARRARPMIAAAGIASVLVALVWIAWWILFRPSGAPIPLKL